jgi:hypothetical protein
MIPYRFPPVPRRRPPVSSLLAGTARTSLVAPTLADDAAMSSSPANLVTADSSKPRLQVSIDPRTRAISDVQIVPAA